MFSIIGPKVYRELRRRRGMSQEQLGKAIGTNRHVIRSFETGKSRPDAKQEERMMKVLGVSKLEFGEVSFAVYGDLLETPVGLRDNHGGYEPTTLINDGYRVLRLAAEIPAALVRAVDQRMREIRLQAHLFEFNNSALRELINDSNKALGRRDDKEEAPALRDSD